MWDSLEQVWGSDCLGGGFVVVVSVCVSVFVCVLRVGELGAGLGK